MRALAATAVVLAATIALSTVSTARVDSEMLEINGVTYVLEDLGTLGGDLSEAYAISENGIIGGTAHTASGKTAFVLENGAMSSLGVRGDTHGVNDSGQAAGRAFLSGVGNVAFWHDGTSVELFSFPGAQRGESYAINNSGEVAGYARTASGEFRAFIYDGGIMTDLGTLGGSYSAAFDMNEDGTVVGESTTTNDDTIHAFIYEGGVMTALAPPGATQSHAIGVNNLGDIVGYDDQRAFLYRSGTFETIPDVGGRVVDPWRINDLGDIVGWTGSTAVLYRDGVTYDLNDYLPVDTEWLLRVAYDINNAGVIVGEGLHNGLVRAFRMTPVGATQTGMNVVVSPSVELPGGGTATADITFDSIDQGGATTVTASAAGPALPAGFQLPDEGLFFDVQTTATFSGAIELCFSWPDGAVQNEANVRLLHYENGAWVDVTTSIDTTANVVCGSVTSLSPFVIAELGFEFAGFEPPIMSNGSASIKQVNAGRVIPVKFRLLFQGEPTGEPTATIAVYHVANVDSGTIDTTDLTEATAAGDDGNLFRYDADDHHYVFNLSTKSWAAPATYRIVVTLSDGNTYSVDFSLR